MADFTPINTQEEFDAAIGERLKREKEASAKIISTHEEENKKLTGTIAKLTKDIDEANKKISGYNEEKAGMQSKIKEHESDSAKTRIALEVGLPYAMAHRLTGEDEDAIRKDAEGMFKLIGASTPPPPLRDPEGKPEDEKTAAYKSLLGTLKGEE